MGSWSWEIETGLLTWSEELYNIFELENGHTLTFGQYLEFIHPNDSIRVKAEIDEASRTGSNHNSVCNIITAKGRIRFVYAVSKPKKNNHSMITGFYGTCLDITHLPHLQNAVATQNTNEPLS